MFPNLLFSAIISYYSIFALALFQQSLLMLFRQVFIEHLPFPGMALINPKSPTWLFLLSSRPQMPTYLLELISWLSLRLCKDSILHSDPSSDLLLFVYALSWQMVISFIQLTQLGPQEPCLTLHFSRWQHEQIPMARDQMPSFHYIKLNTPEEKGKWKENLG